MKTIQLLVLFAAGCGLCAAAPPSCRTETRGGIDFEVCERNDTLCSVNPIATPLVKDQIENPSDKWNGCWPAFISISRLSVVPGAAVFYTHVLVVASFVDSERIDMTITVEMPDHTKKEYVKRDLPVIMKNGIPSASIDVVTTFRPAGVPTVEAVEREGKKGAAHSFR